MWRREEARYGRNIASCASVGVSRRWYPIWGIILVIKLVQWRWTNISIRLNYCTCVLVQLIEEMEGSYYSWCKCKKWKNCNFTKEVEGKKGKSVEHLVSRATINGSIEWHSLRYFEGGCGGRAFKQLVADDGSHFRVGLELKFFPLAN